MSESDIPLINVAFQETKPSRVIGNGIIHVIYWSLFTWLCVKYRIFYLKCVMPAVIIFLIWSFLNLFRRYLVYRYGAGACLKPDRIIAVNEVYTNEKYRFTETSEQDRFGAMVRSINVYKKDSDVAVKFKVVRDGEDVIDAVNALTGRAASGGLSFDYCEKEEGDYR